MSDLISRESIVTLLEQYGYIDKEMERDLEAIPSADIMECARAIKEYCEKYDESCVGCPFNSARPTKWCALGGSSLPYEWDLPEGEAKPNESLIKDCCEAQGHLWADNNIFEDVEENQ